MICFAEQDLDQQMVVDHGSGVQALLGTNLTIIERKKVFWRDLGHSGSIYGNSCDLEIHTILDIELVDCAKIGPILVNTIVSGMPLEAPPSSKSLKAITHM